MTSPAPLAPPGRDPESPRSYHVTADGEFRTTLSLEEMQQVIAAQHGRLWVDVDATSLGQVRQFERLTTLHPLALEDALNPVSRGKIEEYNGFLFMIIRGVRFHAETEDPYDLETFNIACFLGPSFLITVHHGKSDSVAGAVERLVRNPDLLGRGADRMMHLIMDAAVDAYFPLLDQIDDFVDSLEERVFEQFDDVVLRDIFAVKRLVLSLRRHLGPQREVFNVLSNRPSPYLGPEGQLYFRDIHDHVLRITESLETYRDLLGSTMDSYLTQVSNRLGMATKGLSAVATVSIPFVIVSGMWGMNFAHMPFAEAPDAFWWMLFTQLAAGLLLYMLLRWRRLL